MLVLVVACSQPPLPGQGELAEVHPPQDLQTLDLAVREQLDELWQHLQAIPYEAGNRAELAGAWGALGQWCHVYKYDQSAVTCYENARLLDPTEPRWPYYLGLLAEDGSDLERAAEMYGVAAALAPDEVAPRVRLGDLALLQQDVERASAVYSEILDSHPEDPGALYGIGQVRLMEGNAQAALEPLEALAQSQPKAVQVRYALALAWRQLGDEQHAADQLGRVPSDNFLQVPLTLDDPWEAELQACDRGGRTLCRRGVAASRRGHAVQAAELFGRAVRADPVGAEKRLNYGISLREIGRWQESAEQLEEAVRLAGEGSEMQVRAETQLGLLRIDQGRPRDAVLHLETALAIDPGDVAAHLALGRILHRRGRLDEALAHYGAVRDIDRAYPETRFWYSAVLIVLGRRAEAFEALHEDLRILDDDVKLRLLLIRLLSTAEEAAVRDLARARQLLDGEDLPHDVMFGETAAMVAAGEGRFDKAVAWQRVAVTALVGQRPREAEHRARRRLVLYQQGSPCRQCWEDRETPLDALVSAP